MNATALYVSTCRYILQADFENSESWGDLYRLLPYLRQSLSCCVCGALLVNPQGPTDSNCQHFVCRTCLGGKMLLKPSCSWCKDYGKFAEVPQLKILLSCYKKLCEYIAATPIARSFVGTNGESNTTHTILQEGMAIIASHESSKINHGKAINVLDILSKLDLSKSRENGSDLKCTGRRRGRGKRQRDRESSGGRGASPLLGLGPHRDFVNAEATAHLRIDGLCNGMDSGPSSDHLDTSDDHSFYSSSLSNSDTSGIKSKRRHDGEHKVKSKKKKKKRDKDKNDKKIKERKSPKLKDSKIKDARQRRLMNLRKHRLKAMKKKRIINMKNKLKLHTNLKLVNGEGSPRSAEPESVLDTPRKKTLVISGHRALLVKAGKSLPIIHGCRCGTWNRYPGANTCRGNRCPCFMSEKGCDKCKCRGCRNLFGRVTEESKKNTGKILRSDNGESDEGDVDVTNM